MTMTTQTTPLPTVAALKAQARRLRETLADQGTTLGHSQSLELLSRQLGFRDWNTLHAAADTPPTSAPKAPVALGQKVSGHYLGLPFTGVVKGLREVHGGHFEVTLQFDTPVDVVRFESFSSLRHRVSATIDATGVSPRHTSNGEPHLRLDLSPAA
ncbi:glyoxalase superfamily protein [Tropicimonas sp.]|uniref:glyoxalase superfamily protein n=1 Tax=Tropicimonas sp. TaxID=2067044 RepID=UPI003A86896F